MRAFKNILNVLLLVVTALFASCNDDDDDASPEPTPVVTAVTICSDGAYTWEVNNITYDGAEGTQTVFVDGVNGEADQTLNITVASEATTVVTDVTICSDDTYTWDVNTITYDGADGTQTVSIEGVDCAADQTLNITVTPKPTPVITDVTICSNETYTWPVNATTYDGADGTQTVAIEGVDCEADQTLNITVTPEPAAVVTNISISATESYTWPVNATTYDASDGNQTVFIEGVDCEADQTLNITVTVAIGDFIYGGVVFWVDPADNSKGLACAVDNVSFGAEWGCSGTDTGATDTEVGTGAANTGIIEASCTTAGTAADLCASLVLSGYDDWFLPSRLELVEFYNNKDVVNAAAVANGGSTPNQFHWSSTEVNATSGGIVNLTTGSTGGAAKSSNYGVRPVRAF